MRGLFFDRGEVSLRDDLPSPREREGWTRVRVLRAGVCATDLALRRGYMGFRGVPGHEFVGVAVDGPHRARRVVGEINAACGGCAACRAGDDRHCPERTVLGILGHSGAFAELLALPDRNLLPVPEEVPTEAATFTEPLAAALQIGTQVGVRPGMAALVAGDGKLGLLCAHALAHHGAEVTVAGRHPGRQALLPGGAALRTGLLEEDGAGAEPAYDLAVEATGRPEVLPRLLGHVRPRGTVVLKTTSERPITADLSVAVVNELHLVGSRCGRFAPALELLAEGRVPVGDMVHARFPLASGPEALAEAGRPGRLKVLLEVGDEEE